MEHFIVVFILFVPKILFSVLYIIFMAGRKGVIHRLYKMETESDMKRFAVGVLIALLCVSVAAVGFYGVIMNLILFILNLIPGIAI